MEALKLNLPIDPCGCLPGFGWVDSAATVTGGECIEGAPTSVEGACEDTDFCNHYFTMDAVVTFLPYYFRFAQQLRRYYDGRKKRELVNAAKYFSSLCVVTLSW